MGVHPPGMRCVIPDGPLSAFVDCLWIQDDYSQPHGRERVLPTTTTDLMFVRSPNGVASSGVTGPRSRYIELSTSDAFSAIGVHFKPGHAGRFFRISGSELDNQSISLEALWGRAATALTDRLWDTDDPSTRFRLLADALHARVRREITLEPAVAHALNVVNRTGGSCRVQDIAASLQMSSRRFLDVFRHEVGLSPKEFCRIQRFRRALEVLDRTVPVEWTDVALSCGYFDQSHFNHDFRRFAGMTPTAYVRNRTSRTHVRVAP